MIIVTGGAGFIGSNFILSWLERFDEKIMNIDNLSYAADLNNLKDIENNSNYSFKKLNIQNQDEITTLILETKPRAILNLAAESHVDRSIEDPENFINSNIVGTYSLLEASLKYWNSLGEKEKDNFRIFHISTDEVFGDVLKGRSKETDPYKPSSPYAASKASSEHLVF